MDAIDRQITAILVVDGRTSFSALGRAVGLSTSAAAARVRRLEADGVIARAPRDTLSREPVDLAGGLSSGRFREVDADYRAALERHFLGERRAP